MCIKHAVVLLVILMNACVSTPPENMNSEWVLVYSGNLDGELEPCGCSEEGDLGGLKRRVKMVDSLRREIPDLFLISSGGLLISETPQDKLTSEYILKGLASLDYDAIGVQWRDLAFGEAFLSRANLPFVTNDANPGFAETERTLIHGKKQIAFFSWLNTADNPMSQMHGVNDPENGQTDGLMKSLTDAKASGKTTILSTSLPLELARKLFDLSHIDVLIIKSRYELFGDPERIGSTLVLQPGSRGMRLGRVDLTVDSMGNIASWRHQVIPLPKSVGDAQRMASWYEEYNDKVREAYEKRVALRKSLESGKSPYAGDQSCSGCHVTEHQKWSSSKHAEAFYALQDAGKAFDPACIICHSVGFDKVGGFIDAETTPSLMHVQCESCHGAAREHVESAGKWPVGNATARGEQICVQCHNHSHSPSFDFATYWPHIAHGMVEAGLKAP